jgi:hypothetical protein
LVCFSGKRFSLREAVIAVLDYGSVPRDGSTFGKSGSSRRQQTGSALRRLEPFGGATSQGSLAQTAVVRRRRDEPVKSAPPSDGLFSKLALADQFDLTRPPFLVKNGSSGL